MAIKDRLSAESVKLEPDAERRLDPSLAQNKESRLAGVLVSFRSNVKTT